MKDYDFITLWKGEDIRFLSREDLIEVVKELAQEHDSLMNEMVERDKERAELMHYKIADSKKHARVDNFDEREL